MEGSSGRVWESVRYELWAMAAVLPLLGSDSRRPWSSKVLTSEDECDTGIAACVRTLPSHVVEAACSWRERWQFGGLLPGSGNLELVPLLVRKLTFSQNCARSRTGKSPLEYNHARAKAFKLIWLH